MKSLRVRTYDVRHGDAILVSIPDEDAGRDRHVLIDVGNVRSGEGGVDTVFEPVLRDVKKVIGDHPLDLYVMTHEHLDHVQGLLAVKGKVALDVGSAWITASAAPDYYDRFPEAKKALDEARRTLDGVRRLMASAPSLKDSPLAVVMKNNDHRETAKCVDHIRGITGSPTYVFRGRKKLPRTIGDAKVEVWAPEEDTFDYYGRFKPLALGLTEGLADSASGPSVPAPPPGVDAGAFYDLVESRRSGWVDNLMAIDAAANNTSVVFCLEWKGWRLLFPGDAEIRSWKTMKRENVLKPVHFLKVGHHGSHNATPSGDILDAILPEAGDGRDRHAVVSTCAGTYSNVPHAATMKELKRRGCTVTSVEDIRSMNKLYVDVELGADATTRITPGGVP